MTTSVGDVAELLTAAIEAHKEQVKSLEDKYALEVEALRKEIEALRPRHASEEQHEATTLEGVVLEALAMPNSGEFESRTLTPDSPCSEPPETPAFASSDPPSPQAMPSCLTASGDSKGRLRRKHSRTMHRLTETADEGKEQLGPVRRFIDGPFDLFVCFLIGLNTIFLIVELQFAGPRVAAEWNIIGSFESSELWASATYVMEHSFNAFFVFELCLRLIVQRRRFFYSRSRRSFEALNIFDLFLVGGTSADLYVQAYLESSGNINMNIFRPLRFLRMVRTLRVLRSTRFLLKLRILLSTVVFSLMALFWSIVLLFATMLMAALFVNQAITLTFEDQTISLERRRWLFQMYGTSAKAFYTIFELTFSGGWPNYVRPLVEEVSPWWAVFFIAYIIIVTFAMFRIITALFLRDTLALAANDADIAVEENILLKEATADKLLAFFHAADTSGDGIMSSEEFTEMLAEPKVGAWLSLLELDVTDAMSVFALLEHQRDFVTADDFVKGMMRIKGQARSQDIIALHHITKEVRRDLEDLRKLLEMFDKSLPSTQLMRARS